MRGCSFSLLIRSHLKNEQLVTGKFIAIASTTVETSNPLLELEPAIRLLGNYIERFDSVSARKEGGREGGKEGKIAGTPPSHLKTTAHTNHSPISPSLSPSLPPPL